MLPSSEYCRRCGGYIRETMTDDGKERYDTHNNLEDCVWELSRKQNELQEAWGRFVRLEQIKH